MRGERDLSQALRPQPAQGEEFYLRGIDRQNFERHRPGGNSNAVT